MNFSKTTEQSSLYNNLEQMSASELLTHINNEDKKVAIAVEKATPQILALVEQIVPKLKQGGRVFYMGAGTSGRLGILDASECPPTFGVPHELIVGLIAGGDTAIRKAVEDAEDNTEQGWLDLQKHNVSPKDIVIGIAASGTTPYVLGALKKANKANIITGSITMNENSPLHLIAKYPIVTVVGPEFVTGSSRMKAGTAQKLILNMISTSSMILLGKVKGNKMIDMKLSNSKLVDRANRMVVDTIHVSKEEATSLLKKHGNVRNVLENYKK
ncbi:N-acetylmuramic acid 6-phosphate etherase [Flavicella sp.]|uniref:N-acetylmuramic acid 6-phosphate etherase n=1 Tax=Flavicella sp. TaxID=2957742 RepID=UPI00301B5D54